MLFSILNQTVVKFYLNKKHDEGKLFLSQIFLEHGYSELQIYKKVKINQSLIVTIHNVMLFVFMVVFYVIFFFLW